MSGRREVREVASLAEVEVRPDLLYDAFAVLREVRDGQTRAGDAFVDLSFGDTTAVIGGKIWSDTELMETARRIGRGAVVKIRFETQLYQDRLQAKVHMLREVGEDDTFDAARVLGEGHELVAGMHCASLVFDIETVPAVDRRSLPQTVAATLAKWAERGEQEEATVMGMSPFFGKVVSLAFGDGELEVGDMSVRALVVPPEGSDPDALPDWMIAVTEPQLLQAWWVLASHADTVVSFNGRNFDVPFLIGRSLVHGIPARVDLLSNRYSLRPHLDLYHAFNNGGRARGPASLDVMCWALGIESPKEQMDGSMVAPAYERGDIEKIAEYNAHDVRATAAVYHRLRDGVLRFRSDW